MVVRLFEYFNNASTKHQLFFRERLSEHLQDFSLHIYRKIQLLVTSLFVLP